MEHRLGKLTVGPSDVGELLLPSDEQGWVLRSEEPLGHAHILRVSERSTERAWVDIAELLE